MTVEVLKVLAAPIVGAVLGVCVMVGLVWSQTQPPESNPASQPILTYGD
jgi:hypothetical protein